MKGSLTNFRDSEHVEIQTAVVLALEVHACLESFPIILGPGNKEESPPSYITVGDGRARQIH